jgi:hypothetical protein
MEAETASAILFLDVMVMRKGCTMDTKVYRKHTHWPLSPFPIESPTTFEKRSCAEPEPQIYYHMQKPQDHCNETDVLIHDLQLDAYPIGFTDSVINIYKRSDYLKKEGKPLSFISINYTRGVSERFKSTVNKYNIRTVFKTTHTLRNSHMRTRLKGSPQETVNCVCSIPCQCGRS